jgi:ATP-dependent RNA helicase DeaD
MSQSKDEPQFRDLALSPPLLRAIEELGYEQPTPIQAGAIPPLLEGRDLVGQAQTGTGKTAAFALPLLQRLDMEVRGVQAIVLTPTRELAMQVAEAVHSYGKHLGKRGVSVLPIYGGQPIHIQRAALQRGVHVAIGTPGRVRDHLQRKTLSLGDVRFFGLDEADEMLKMGFIEDVEWILEHAPEDRQIALFSATMPAPIRRVAKRHLQNPIDVKTADRTLTLPSTEQFEMRVGRHEKTEALERVLEAEDYEAVLIFAGTQIATAKLAEHLQGHGYQAECIHGGMNQPQREQVVERLKKRRTRVVVATDVAARGLDVDHIGLVINFDVPRDPEVFVHRIGRTGRAGRAGRAITLWQQRDRNMMRAIERASGQRMESMRIPARSELVDRRREKLQHKLRALTEGDLEAFRNMIREMVRDEGLDPIDLAAAGARVAWGESPLYVAPDPEPKPERGPRSDRKPRTRAPADDDDLVEIVIPVGSWSNVRPGSIVGAIAGETGLPGSVVGRIKILEKVTFVAVKSEHVSKIMRTLKGVTIAGRKVYPRLAHDPGRR